jgi:hypothetical protein
VDADTLLKVPVQKKFSIPELNKFYLIKNEIEGIKDFFKPGGFVNNSKNV